MKEDERENPAPKSELNFGAKNDKKKTKKPVKKAEKQKKEIKVMAKEEVKAKRIRRGIAKVIIDKIDAKANKVDPKAYEQFRSKLVNLMDEFEKLIDSNKAALKAEKNKFKKLSKFSKEELEAYLKTL